MSNAVRRKVLQLRPTDFNRVEQKSSTDYLQVRPGTMRPRTRSWMRRDGDDCNLILLWAVAPEYAAGAGRAVLNVSLEDLRVTIVGILDRVIFVCLQTRVARV